MSHNCSQEVMLLSKLMGQDNLWGMDAHDCRWFLALLKDLGLILLKTSTFWLKMVLKVGDSN